MNGQNKIKIGLTLSGGGAKGIAHIGVIQALVENGIEPTIISGTSAGSIIGAFYAAGIHPEGIKYAVNNSSFYKVFRLAGLPSVGFSRLDYLHERLNEFIPQDSFESLKYPLYVCATNLNQGRPVLFNTGTLFDKVLASCAVPWLFSPILIDGEMFADGGITNNFPANAIRDQCDILIGSNVKPKVVVQSNKDLNSYLAIAQRVTDLSLWTNSKPNVKLLDVYITSEKIRDYSSFGMNKTNDLCAIGYDETMNKMEKIKQVIAEKVEKLEKAAFELNTPLQKVA